MSCPFCEIVQGNAPVSAIHRDERVMAFMDIQPVNPGHALVVPVRHATFLADVPPDVAAHLLRVGRQVAAAVRASGVRAEGVNLFLADGEAAGQEVFHVHLHVIPRFAGDGFGLRFGPHYGQRPERAALDALAGTIASKLDRDAS